MVQAITNYTFNAGTKAITFTDLGSITLERLRVVKNLTTNQWIYKFSDTTLYGGSVATNVLTFTTNNAGMNNTDKLMIFYDLATSFDTQLIGASTLPLPTGAATAANQTTGNTSLLNLDSKTPALVSGRSPVDGSGVTQPVSGTFWQATQPVSAASLPLPTGAATETTLAAASAKLPATLGQKTKANSLAVTLASDQDALPITDNGGSLTVDGTFWQATQPISGTVTANVGTTNGLALDATLTGGSQKSVVRGGAKGATTAADVTSTSIDADHNALDVSVKNFPATQPVSAASLPLPSGASTSAKQPTLGTAGTPSADVISVQGVTSMTPLKVDGSASTQPVSGTITANIGTAGSLALDATLTGGTQKAIARGGAKGSTTAADITSTASGANHQPLDVAIYDGSGNQVSPLTDTQLRATALPVSGTFFPATQNILSADSSVTGSITATDAVVAAPATDGTMRSGASTANSYVGLASPGGQSGWIILINGTLSGTYYFEGSADATTAVNGNWIGLNARQSGNTSTSIINNTTTAGTFRGTAAGFKFIRVRNVGGGAQTANVVINLSSGTSAVLINGALPAGANVIGKTSIDQTTPGTTNAVNLPDGTASGSITTLNLNLAAGAATAGSTVALSTFSMFGSASIQVTGTWTGTLQPQVSIDGTNWINIGPKLLNLNTGIYSSFIVSASIGIFQTDISANGNFRVTASAAMTGTAVVTIRTSQATIQSNKVTGDQSNLMVTATGAVNTAVTATLPAVAGQFHYITSIQISKLYGVIGVAAGAGVIITSTNIPGTPAWTTEQLASPAGTVVRVVDLTPVTPIKSSVVNTATTIVCPIQLQSIWRINISYFAAS